MCVNHEAEKQFLVEIDDIPSGQTGQTDSETGTQLNETGVKRKLLGQVVGDQDRHDQTVYTNDTSHDNGDNV